MEREPETHSQASNFCRSNLLERWKLKTSARFVSHQQAASTCKPRTVVRVCEFLGMTDPLRVEHDRLPKYDTKSHFL